MQTSQNVGGPRGKDEALSSAAAPYLRPDGAPAWDAISAELSCPRCAYNLRMLERPRCPECGLDFAWRLLIVEQASRSKFLFEHHCLRRPLRSWLHTLMLGLWPPALWSRVSIYERISVVPLIVLSLTAPLLLAASLYGMALSTGWVLTRDAVRTHRGYSWISPSTPLQSAGNQLLVWAFFPRPILLELPAVFALTSLALLLLLVSLRQTLGRCKVRTLQVLRIWAYACGPMALATAVFIVALPFLEELAVRRCAEPNLPDNSADLGGEPLGGRDVLRRDAAAALPPGAPRVARRRDGHFCRCADHACRRNCLAELRPLNAGRRGQLALACDLHDRVARRDLHAFV